MRILLSLLLLLALAPLAQAGSGLSIETGWKSLQGAAGVKTAVSVGNADATGLKDDAITTTVDLLLRRNGIPLLDDDSQRRAPARSTVILLV